MSGRSSSAPRRARKSPSAGRMASSSASRCATPGLSALSTPSWLRPSSRHENGSTTATLPSASARSARRRLRSWPSSARTWASRASMSVLAGSDSSACRWRRSSASSPGWRATTWPSLCSVGQCASSVVMRSAAGALAESANCSATIAPRRASGRRSRKKAMPSASSGRHAASVSGSRASRPSESNSSEASSGSIGREQAGALGWWSFARLILSRGAFQVSLLTLHPGLLMPPARRSPARRTAPDGVRRTPGARRPVRRRAA